MQTYNERTSTAITDVKMLTRFEKSFSYGTGYHACLRLQFYMVSEGCAKVSFWAADAIA